MNTLLADLLQASQPKFGLAIDQLELSSGNSGQDVRLTAEIVTTVQNKIKQLGLDPQDTTSQELYGALMNLISMHDRFLSQRLGLDLDTTQKSIRDDILTLVRKLGINKTCWVIKHSVAKRIIKAHPPKKVMKILGYRSADSMLKREEISKIFIIARLFEDARWLNALFKLYKKIQPSDFEVRDVEFINIGLTDHNFKSYLSNIKTDVYALEEIGCIGFISQNTKYQSGLTIATLAFAVHFINEVRLYSAYLKHVQTNNEFGSKLVDLLSSGNAHIAKIGQQKVHWRILHNFYGQQDPSNHPELFDPHVQPEDLQWRSTEEVLFRLEPALQFWHGTDFVGKVFDDGPVSFHILDMTQNVIKNNSFKNRSIKFMQASLWNELLIRYIGQPILEHLVLKQLDQQEFNPELVDLSIIGV